MRTIRNLTLRLAFLGLLTIMTINVFGQTKDLIDYSTIGQEIINNEAFGKLKCNLKTVEVLGFFEKP